MIRHNIKTTFRALIKLSLFSMLNMLGLIVALVVFFLILQFASTEYHADSTFEKGETIFRVIRTINDENSSFQSPTLAATYKNQLAIDLDISQNQILRLFRDNELVTYDNKSFFESNVLFADKYFFEIFNYPFLFGNPLTALEKPNSVVLSTEMAKKYFGENNPIGKIIELEGKGLLEVTGVLSQMKVKSHLQIDFIAPISALGYTSRLLTNSEIQAFSYYLLISQDNKWILSNFEKLTNRYFEKGNNYENNIKLSLQPLVNIYFDEPMRNDLAEHGNKKLVNGLLVIAILVLLIAGVNFLNLTLAAFLKRIKEVGIRKILGSSQKVLIFQFLLEIYFSITIVVILALICSIYLIRINENLNHLKAALAFDAKLILGLIGFSFILTLLFGLYPAVVLSSQNISSALSKKIGNLKSSFLQDSLLIFQFFAAIVLIILSIVVSKQFDFLQQKEIGLITDQILVFDSNNKHSWKNKELIRQEVERLNGVKSVAMIYGGLPEHPTESYAYITPKSDRNFLWKTAFTSLNAIDVLQLKILDGRDFDPMLKSDKGNSAILNETAAKELGWPSEDIVGRTLVRPGLEFKEPLIIIGVIKDYHFESYKNQIEPLVITSTDWEETFVVKLTSKSYQNTIKEIEAIWSKYVPKYPFTYQFLDDTFKKMHIEDTKQRIALYLFSALSILISTIGVLGLSSFILELKTKEIAIRAVLGASLSNMLKLFSAKFIKLLCIASFIAVPLSLFLAELWLTDFKYRIKLDIMIFIYGCAAVMVTIISLLCLQIWKATVSNPTENLSNE